MANTIIEIIETIYYNESGLWISKGDDDGKRWSKLYKKEKQMKG